MHSDPFHVDVVLLRLRGAKLPRETVLAAKPVRGTIYLWGRQEMASPRRWLGPEIAIFNPSNLRDGLPYLDGAREIRRNGPDEWLLGGIEMADYGREERPQPQVWWVRRVG